jgi:hypothetical protein
MYLFPAKFRYIVIDTNINKKAVEWINNLVDWSQIPALGDMTPRESHGFFIAYPDGEPGVEVARFLKALQIPFRFAYQTEEMPPTVILATTPKVTENGRKQFLKILCSIDSILCEPYVEYGVPGNKPVFFFSEARNESLRELSSKALQRLRVQAEKASSALEKFTQFYPEDRYLGGLGNLFACIMRVHWSADLKGTLARLESLESRYSDHKTVQVMSAWYRSLLLLNTKDGSASNTLKSIIDKYSGKGWNVVDRAKYCLEDSSYYPQIARIFFYTPLRCNK